MPKENVIARPWLVLTITSVLFRECQVIAQERTEAEAMLALNLWREDNPGYRGEVAIAEVRNVVFLDLGGG